MDKDTIDTIIDQWAREWPALDTSAKAVTDRIARIGGHLDRRFQATLAAQDLTLYGVKLLATLRRAGPPYRLAASELARRLRVSSGAMTNQIDQLEAAGLVARLPDPTDRRVVRVALTPTGRRRVDAAVLDCAADERRALAALTDADRATLERLLRKLLLSFEAAAAGAGPRPTHDA